LGDHAERQAERQHAQRDDQQEDAAPAFVIDQHAAERRTDDEGKAVTARPDAERQCALVRIRIDRRKDRERGRHLQRRPNARDGAPGYERGDVRRETADQRAESEEGKTEAEYAAPPMEISQHAAGQQ